MHSAELDRWQTEHVARARAEAHVATLTEQQEEMRLLQEELTKQARQLKEQLEAAAQEKEDALVLQRMDLLKVSGYERDSE
jgi:flagellar biosynthesis/type III secretory pathway protein FliH